MTGRAAKWLSVAGVVAGLVAGLLTLGSVRSPFIPLLLSCSIGAGGLGLLLGLLALPSPRKRDAWVAIVAGAIPLLAAAIVPSLFRACCGANESAVIGDIRTMISAEAAYQSLTGGSYGTIECLVAPSGCIPDYRGPTFLDPSMLRPARHGYRASFHPGPPSDPVQSRLRGNAGSDIDAYAYVWIPVEPGKTGVRAFCGDATGRICFTDDGSIPEVRDGSCPSPCRTLD